MASFIIQKGTQKLHPFAETTLEESCYRVVSDHIELTIRLGGEFLGSCYIRQGKDGIEIYVPSVPASQVTHFGEKLFNVDYEKRRGTVS